MAECLIPILALAAAAAGTGLQVAGTSRAKDEMNQKTLNELARQRQIQGKAANEFATSLSKSGTDTAQTQLAQGETEKLGGYDKLQSIPLAAGSQPIVGGQNPVLNVRDTAQMNISNKGRAKLGAYDKWILDQAVKNLRSGQQQGIYNQEAYRSQNILPMELQDASHAGDALTGAGMGLGALSSILSLGAGSGWGLASSAAAQAPSLYNMQSPQYQPLPYGGYGYH